jgi:hypothetical protein
VVLRADSAVRQRIEGRVSEEEPFGPVVTVEPFTGEEQAVGSQRVAVRPAQCRT